jgi:hypothetical protein
MQPVAGGGPGEAVTTPPNMSSGAPNATITRTNVMASPPLGGLRGPSHPAPQVWRTDGERV